jgi:hypothetical protein
VNTGRASLLTSLLFVVALIGTMALIQVNPVAAAAAGAVIALSFIYTMYLWLWGMGKGDPRLLRRGLSGTAEVIEAKETSIAMASGQYYGIGAPMVWKYKLEVTRPGHSPYKTVLYICAQVREGTTVPVKISRWNHKRVTIDGPALSESGGGGRSERREQGITVTFSKRGDS